MSVTAPACYFTSTSWDISLEKGFELLSKFSNVLAENSWIYSTRNTELFVYDTLEKIPNEWVEAISPLSFDELKNLPYGFIKDSWPLSLKTFLTNTVQLAELRFPKDVVYLEKDKIDFSSSSKKNIPFKKKQEILAMSCLVHQVSKRSNCNRVLDVGSGLGYLDEILHHEYGFQCIGVDCVKRLTDSARNRLDKDPCLNCICYETLKLQNNDDCIESLKTIFNNVENVCSVCACDRVHDFGDSEKVYAVPSYTMIGLHCCGNLMQDMMSIFQRMKEAQAFVGVGCCYNKINLQDFPKSKTANGALEGVQKKYPLWHPCVSGLRLASHATRSNLYHSSVENLDFAVKNTSFRSIIELYIQKENINWRKPKRRVRPEDVSDFKAYCDIMFQHIASTDEDNQKRMNKLQDIYSAKEKLFPRVRLLLVLQTLLQPLYECFVLLDRMMYFKEESFETKVCFLWDDYTSPRNMALCAFKT